MITLLTDFGSRDYFVPAVKGVILTINPQANIIDLTHDIPAQDIAAAAFTLGACYQNFPPGSIHLAVVDPGVGSARLPIVVETEKFLFVGPDNGIFSFVYARESKVRVYWITRDEYFRHPVSATFHGRDIFAPIAGGLSRGMAPDSVGEPFDDYIKLELPQPAIDQEQGTIEGCVIHIDHFGNCITNLTPQDLPPDQVNRSPVKMIIVGCEVARFGTHFAEAKNQAQLFAYLGSAGYWEIALWCDSASQRLGINLGAPVTIIKTNRINRIFQD